ncbi:ATP-binding protein [Fontisphaera persica]|uniref:two-component system sensor histidine kinase NtrB n=1 Tax=Fontisphaera persica TaxID=2974023 RepID=UPI0024BF3BFB|nr:ATP-binding protein [Fontisphaera persica]WCJ57853.1 ATP-binding protein [Fontisphaera persica]
MALLAASLIGWITRQIWTQLAELQHEFAAMEAESYYLGTRLGAGVERLDGSLLRFQLSDSAKERDRFHEEARALGELLARTRPRLASALETNLVAQWEQAFTAYLADAAPLLDKGVRAVRKDSAAVVAAQIHQISQPLRDLSDRLIASQKTSWRTFLGGSHRTLVGLQQSALMALGMLILCTSTLFLLAHRLAVAPLRRRLSAAQAVLEKQEKLASLGTLAAGVAHEIRNPLASLKFRLFSLKESLPPEFANHDDVVVMGDEINRLERILKDFLQFARPSEPSMAVISAQQTLQTVYALLRPQLQARGIRLVLELGEDLQLRADKQQLEQVLINLVQNAADSIEGQGTVTLRLRQGAARLDGRSVPAAILEIADTGKGIPPDVQSRLFDPFFSTKAGGSGLGLAISERIIEKHGGVLQYQTQLNRGTTFQVVLPRTEYHDSPNPSH